VPADVREAEPPRDGPLPLPTIVSPVPAEQIPALLDAEARKGRLAGLVTNAEGSGRQFAVRDFGHPFEGVLTGLIESVRPATGDTTNDSAPVGDQSRVTFTLKLKPMLPIVFATVLIASVWPGVLLTDSMLKTYFTWYTIPTWWWYFPLTIPFIPFAWLKAMRRSRESMHTEAAEIVARIDGVLNAAPK